MIDIKLVTRFIVISFECLASMAEHFSKPSSSISLSSSTVYVEIINDS